MLTKQSMEQNKIWCSWAPTAPDPEDFRSTGGRTQRVVAPKRGQSPQCGDRRGGRCVESSDTLPLPSHTALLAVRTLELES